MVGVKVSVVMVDRSPGSRLQMPIAEPAAIAAPRAVVSGIEGFTEIIIKSGHRWRIREYTNIWGKISKVKVTVK